MDNSNHPLIRFLRAPQSAHLFQVSDWESLLQTARRSQLLARVAWIAAKSGLTSKIHDKINLHLQSALRIAESQARSVSWETRQLQDVLASTGVPFVLLKGAAYITANLEAGRGRLMSDIDIMVPRNKLESTEKILVKHGWFPTKIDAYDQRYYRTWMHELPPLRHLERGTSLDVHHTILPPTASLKPDVEKLWQETLQVADNPLVRVLAPVDMILHSAVHLFHDGDMQHGLRDLVDIDALIKQFAESAGFWEILTRRAAELDLLRPCYYALKYCRFWLATPIPETAYVDIKEAGSPSNITGLMMDKILSSSLGTALEPVPTAFTHISNFMVYVRSHYLRMPLYLLIPHLIRKQFHKEKG